MNQKQFYLESIKYNPSYSSAYINLAHTMTSNEKIILHDGRKLNKNGLISIAEQLKK
jgi:hypothetical protein